MGKLIIAISGSSGAVYAHQLIERLGDLKAQWSRVGIVISANALINWELELGRTFVVPDGMEMYSSNDFMAPFASGSAKFDTMIICPCSMGTLSRVATGISNDLMTRAADVILKERRKLILVPRETPLSLIHLKHMVSLTECGAIILPASPSFYHRPVNVAEVIDTVVDRVLDHAGFDLSIKRWGD